MSSGISFKLSGEVPHLKEVGVRGVITLNEPYETDSNISLSVCNGTLKENRRERAHSTESFVLVSLTNHHFQFVLSLQL
ncbi:hypothetical protein RchiOBHm_Chr2g0148771 [Rosa chinensis]|uniref:Uncharacterized protein n=1 Tax=Rosa chinensis TaxID=74649 RepID=A0A2P6RZI0_ROSCH|nr:hypothetical protein RchiOBHm_Chr2g0148771 [Rosa chinensis]